MGETKLTPLDPEYYSDKTLQELNKIFKEHVAKLRFEEAKAVEVAIENKKKSNFNEYINTSYDELKNAIDRALEAWSEDGNEIDREQRNSEIEIREKIDGYVESALTSHANQIVELEKKYAYEILKSREKKVVAQVTLERQARNVALEGDLDNAIELRNKAEKAYYTEMERRRDELDKLFNTRRQTLKRSQQNELAVIVQNLEYEMSECNKKIFEKRNNAEKKFSVAVVSSIQNQLVIISKIIKPKERPIAAELITKYARKYVKDCTQRDDLVPDIENPQSAVSTPKSPKSTPTKAKGSTSRPSTPVSHKK